MRRCDHHRRLLRRRLLSLGEVIRCDFSAYPNVQRWLDNMKRLPSWPKVNEVLYGYAGSVKDQSFEAIRP